MSMETGTGKGASNQDKSQPSQGTTYPVEATALEEAEAQFTPKEPVTSQAGKFHASESTGETESLFQADSSDSKPHASNDETGDNADEALEGSPRQVIAVSASKGPAAFFNLARRFLATDEMCDLSALEGAIVSAVDAAHLLERSQLATIVRVNTSYVTVEPKRRKQTAQSGEPLEELANQSEDVESASGPSTPESASKPDSNLKDDALSEVQDAESTQENPSTSRPSRGQPGRELRRARIVITVKRTESYKRWLDENPLHAITSGDGDEPDLDPPSIGPK